MYTHPSACRHTHTHIHTHTHTNTHTHHMFRHKGAIVVQRSNSAASPLPHGKHKASPTLSNMARSSSTRSLPPGGQAKGAAATRQAPRPPQASSARRSSAGPRPLGSPCACPAFLSSPNPERLPRPSSLLLKVTLGGPN